MNVMNGFIFSCEIWMKWTVFLPKILHYDVFACFLAFISRSTRRRHFIVLSSESYRSFYAIWRNILLPSDFLPGQPKRLSGQPGNLRRPWPRYFFVYIYPFSRWFIKPFIWTFIEKIMNVWTVWTFWTMNVNGNVQGTPLLTAWKI